LAISQEYDRKTVEARKEYQIKFQKWISTLTAEDIKRENKVRAYKKKSRLVDPRKPTRPASAFALFIGDRVPKLRQQNPNSPVTEAVKNLAVEWKGLSVHDKLVSI
jgi:hypothetical protein